MLNSGETASGKYENHRPAIKPLDLSVSNPGKKDPNLQNQDPLLISSLKYSETHAHFQSEYFPFQKFIDRAYFLGIQPSALENALSYKTKMVKKELCTIFLDPDGGSNNCIDLAKTVYSPVHMACPPPAADGGARVDARKVEVP
ncbi:hypothetical protein SCLCIDRAFT_18753 [Scleroderma citrinum Foug A]|uniref:Uncharacterized protein n=1 Tax=Scleroderma citrinum Foug A TaxID=1036808 RepID=A0A0C3ESB3_9AGAM|nr:hypothetical protein SCLCIDRAFT_18753 [Scleroderma citrinum Foug A]